MMVNSKRLCLVAAAVILLAAPARAQYSADFQTNIISGVTSNWSGDYILGTNTHDDALLIQNGGVLSNGSGSVGYGTLSNGNNVVIVSGSGSVWNNGGGLDVGTGFDFADKSVDNQLIITNGGAVYSDGGAIGAYFGDNNAVVVTGPGSVWSNTADLTVGGTESRNNSLTIAGGGAAYNNSVVVGVGQGPSYDAVLVTGSGSVLSTGSLLLGGAGQNSMVVSNGGVVNSSSSSGIYGDGPDSVFVTGKGSVWNSGSLVIGGPEGSSLTVSDGGEVCSFAARASGGAHSSALVTGSGSVWDIQTSLVLGPTGCSVTVSNGGTVIAGDVVDGYTASLSISDGALYVTNGLGSGSLAVSGTLTFNSGTLATRATTINNGSVFTVGDGTDQATFIIEPGGSGFHAFANGLTISSNAVLKGVGTVIGSTTVNPCGTLSPGDAPGSITFSNSLTLASGSTFAVELDGAGEGQYSRLVGLDTLSVSNSILNVTLGYTPSAGDTFTIISNLSATAVLGTFVRPDGTALTEGAEFVVDGTTFQIDYTANSDGQDVVLTALIPEPSALLLASLAALLLCPLLKRRQPLQKRPC